MTRHPASISPVVVAAKALKDKADEVNRLNVFPVPDGDTGTNMSLTMDAVLAEVALLGDDSSVAEICHAITQGSLMGARGNSGVILSQIIRGVCDVVAEADSFDLQTVSSALSNSEKVAFQAVRKPVEGTMLTVLRDSATAAEGALRADMPMDEAMRHVVAESFASVRRTPDLLPVLKENGVVDAGGYGLAILAEGLLAGHLGEEVASMEMLTGASNLDLSVIPENDWDDQEYLYCTEFLLFGSELPQKEIEDFVSSQGGSELVVGSEETLKIHVHVNEPGVVLTKMSEYGEVGEVHIHNMRRQTADRSAALRVDQTQAAASSKYGFVGVAAGSGLAEILTSLGVDAVVSGGQTMNPSTAELNEAAQTLNAEEIIILPNNKNIIMAARQVSEVSEGCIHVVPTKSVPEAFAALLAFDEGDGVQANVEAMTAAASSVRTGEVTTAIKDSQGKVGEIKEGQVIGISAGEIEVLGTHVTEVALGLAALLAEDAGVLTVLAGEELDDEDLGQLVSALEQAHPDLEIDAHRGEQPLYPVILAAE